jgi:hypothetical protein
MSRREAERKLLNALAAGELAATWDNDTLPRVWFERAEFYDFSNSLDRSRGGLGLKHTFDKPPMSVDGQVATINWFDAAWPTFKLAELERVFPAPAPALQTRDMANVEVADGRAESAGETPSPANGGAERGQAITRQEIVASEDETEQQAKGAVRDKAKQSVRDAVVAIWGEAGVPRTLRAGERDKQILGWLKSQKLASVHPRTIQRALSSS